MLILFSFLGLRLAGVPLGDCLPLYVVVWFLKSMSCQHLAPKDTVHQKIELHTQLGV
jgi:hypothetical protein